MKFKTTTLLGLFTIVTIFASDLDFDSNLSGWIIANKPNVTVEDGTETEGVSVKLKNNSNIRRTLNLEPNTKYRITFQIKGENISSEPNQGAAILLNAGNKWERITSLFGNEPETGTFDWRKGEEIIDTANFTDNHVKIILRLSGPGTVWFRNVKIEKITSDAEFELRSGVPGWRFGRTAPYHHIRESPRCHERKTPCPVQGPFR